jgi:hypothetical protein
MPTSLPPLYWKPSFRAKAQSYRTVAKLLRPSGRRDHLLRMAADLDRKADELERNLLAP